MDAKFVENKKTIDDQLLLKANKNSVATALHKKANKTDLTEGETQILSKVEAFTEKINQDLKDSNDAFVKKYDKKISNHKE